MLLSLEEQRLPAAPSGGSLPWLPGESVAATWEGKEVRSSGTRGPGGETGRHRREGTTTQEHHRMVPINMR